MTTAYPGDHYEYEVGSGITRQYYNGGGRVAMRVSGDPEPGNNGVFYTLGDHLGSTSITVDESGAVVAELRYKAWGETRYTNGETPTTWRYTGQRQEEGLGLYYYRARWYDSYLNRWTQPDPVVPNYSIPQSFNRYTYVNNNPIRFKDPSGYMHDEGQGSGTHPCTDRNSNGICDNQEIIPPPSYNIALERGLDAYKAAVKAYQTYTQIVAQIGSEPSLIEIIEMTVTSEYWAYRDIISVRDACQEGLARSFYEWCPNGVCTYNNLWMFLSGYEPWSGSTTDSPIISDAISRASTLIKNYRNQSPQSFELLHQQSDTIINAGSSTMPYSIQAWTNGMISIEPWQWYGPIYIGGEFPGGLGYSNDNFAILAVNLGKNYYFLVFTAYQDSDPDSEWNQWKQNH